MLKAMNLDIAWWQIVTKDANAFIAVCTNFLKLWRFLSSKGMDSEYVFPMPLPNKNTMTKLKDLASLAGIKKKAHVMNKTARRSAIQF